MAYSKITADGICTEICKTDVAETSTATACDVLMSNIIMIKRSPYIEKKTQYLRCSPNDVFNIIPELRLIDSTETNLRRVLDCILRYHCPDCYDIIKFTPTAYFYNAVSWDAISAMSYRQLRKGAPETAKYLPDGFKNHVGVLLRSRKHDEADVPSCGLLVLLAFNDPEEDNARFELVCTYGLDYVNCGTQYCLKHPTRKTA